MFTRLQTSFFVSVGDDCPMSYRVCGEGLEVVIGTDGQFYDTQALINIGPEAARRLGKLLLRATSEHEADYPT